MKPAVALLAGLLAASVVAGAVLFRSASQEREKLKRALAAERQQRQKAEAMPEAPAPDPAVDDRLRALEGEIAKLKAKNAELEKKAAERPSPAGVFLELQVQGEEKAPTPEEIAGWQALCMNPLALPDERVKALLKLRMTRDGRSEEVVRSILELLHAAPDPELRADILRHLKKAVPLLFKDSILKVLTSDPSEKVREEAAETLGPLGTDPAVRAALENASKNDPSEKVRKQAERSLK